MTPIIGWQSPLNFCLFWTKKLPVRPARIEKLSRLVVFFSSFLCFKLLGRSSNQLAAFVIVWRKGWWFWEIWDGNPTWEGSKCRDGTLKTLDLEARWSKYLSRPQVTMSHETMSLRRDLWHFIPVKTTRDGIGTVHVAFADLEEVEKVSHSSRITVNIFASRLPPLRGCPLYCSYGTGPSWWSLDCSLPLWWFVEICPQHLPAGTNRLKLHHLIWGSTKSKTCSSRTNDMFTSLRQFLMNLSFFSGTGNFAICAHCNMNFLAELRKKTHLIFSEGVVISSARTGGFQLRARNLELGSNFSPENYLGGGLKYFLCSSLFGEDSHFD